MIFWSMTIAVSVALLVLTAAMRGEGVHMAYLHMAIAMMTSVTLAIVGVREVGKLADEGKPEHELAALNGRYMAMIWSWGALALAVTYGTGIASWKEWLPFFVAFAVAAGLCFFVSARLRDAEVDGGFVKIARRLALFQLIGMVMVMVGLLVDGKMHRFLEIQRLNWQDWAANNYFFFGALGLAIVSAYGLYLSRGDGSSAREA